MVRMKLTVRTTTCMTWSNFKDLQHNASWCEIQWNTQNSRPPHTTCTFYLTFVATPAFFAIIDGALSIAIPTARDQHIPILFSTPTESWTESWKLQRRVENIVGCYGIDHRYESQELLCDRQSLINATNEYGLLCNVWYVRAFIERNRKYNKRLDIFFQMAV